MAAVRRRLLNLLTALSLLLCVAVCVLWVRSYRVADTFVTARNAAVSGLGKLVVLRSYGTEEENAPAERGLGRHNPDNLNHDIGVAFQKGNGGSWNDGVYCGWMRSSSALRPRHAGAVPGVRGGAIAVRRRCWVRPPLRAPPPAAVAAAERASPFGDHLSEMIMRTLRPTDRLRRAMRYAEARATAAGASRPDAGHLLVGLLRERLNVGAIVLRDMGVTLGRVTRALSRGSRASAAGRGGQALPSARTTLTQARHHARSLADGDVGSQHVLLAMADDERTSAVLESAGAHPSRVRDAVLQLVVPRPPSGGSRTHCPGRRRRQL
jgi:hypothetical protein